MNLIKSTGTFSFFTVLSRISGYLRDILIAFFLGTGLIADAFFVAFRIPNTFRRLFSEGTFNAAFVPSYTNEQRFGKKKSDIFANQVFNLLLIILKSVVCVRKHAFLNKIYFGIPHPIYSRRRNAISYVGDLVVVCATNKIVKGQIAGGGGYGVPKDKLLEGTKGQVVES